MHIAFHYICTRLRIWYTQSDWTRLCTRSFKGMAHLSKFWILPVGKRPKWPYLYSRVPYGKGKIKLKRIELLLFLISWYLKSESTATKIIIDRLVHVWSTSIHSCVVRNPKGIPRFSQTRFYRDESSKQINHWQGTENDRLIWKFMSSVFSRVACEVFLFTQKKKKIKLKKANNFILHTIRTIMEWLHIHITTNTMIKNSKYITNIRHTRHTNEMSEKW